MFKRKLLPFDRSFQLNFSGLKVNKGIFDPVRHYFKALFVYFGGKIRQLFSLLFGTWKFGFVVSDSVQDYIVRKLIWSRGRLGRRTVNLAILIVAFILFMTGGVFNSTNFVNSAPLSPDYLASEDDVIPNLIVATTALPEGRRTEAVVHTVRGGETLSSIGQLYKVSSDALKYVNNLSDESFLKVGQQLTIPPVQGVMYKVKAGDTCDSIGKKFEVPAQSIADFNYLDSCSNLLAGKDIVVPDARIPAPVPVYTAIPGLPTPNYSNFVDKNPSSGWCQWPTSARIITQYFSWYHNGIDIATPWGVMPPIYACAGGTVIRSGWDPWGLGLHIIIDHGNGYQTVYGHMSKLNVSVGREVDKGDVIGLMGSTGHSTGPHIHFIVKFNGVAQNPLKYIK